MRTPTLFSILALIANAYGMAMFITTFASIPNLLPLLLVSCTPLNKNPYDLQRHKAADPITYQTSITIKRYNRKDDIDTKMTEDDDTSMTDDVEDPTFWWLNLEERKRDPVAGPLYVALHTQGTTKVVIGYAYCQRSAEEKAKDISVNWDEMRPSQTMQLYKVWIHKTWRGRGIATEMVRFALHDLAAYTTSTHVWLLAMHPPAIRVYEKLNFKCICRPHECLMGIELPLTAETNS